MRPPSWQVSGNDSNSWGPSNDLARIGIALIVLAVFVVDAPSSEIQPLSASGDALESHYEGGVSLRCIRRTALP